jgi:uncharacterized RDD family membrane protein YckC
MKIEQAVYFRREDYAGFWRRLAIDAMDVFVVGIVCLFVAIFFWAALPSAAAAVRGFFAVGALVAFLYLVLLKRSKWGTLGYRIGGVRIVGLDGGTPGIACLTVRLIFAMHGPLTWILDLIWLSDDPHRQAIRDKFANTYVVKRGAAPAGTGRVVFRNYEILCYNFLFREVEADTPGPGC